MAQLTLPLVSSTRECGDCKACCTAKNVLSLVKPAGTPCVYLCEVGCSIHADRPSDCKSYKCLWLKGHLDKDQRPDKVGYILDIDLEQTTGKHFFAAVPAWPGAFQEEKVVYRLKRLAKHLNQPIVANGLALIIPLGWKFTIEKTFGNVEVIYA